MTTTSHEGEQMASIMESIPSEQQSKVANEAAALVEKPVHNMNMDDMEPLAMSSIEVSLVNGSNTFEKMEPYGMNTLSWKPKRPLSAYNIFFQHEREKIVSNAPDIPVTLESLKIDPRRPPKKRRHRKSHGKIGFADLTRRIAERWKSIDPESRSVFEACAAGEKQRYKEEIKDWKEAKKNGVIEEEEAAAKNEVTELMFTNNAGRDNMINGVNTNMMNGVNNMMQDGVSASMINGANATRTIENQSDMGSIQRALSSQMMADMCSGQLSTEIPSDFRDYLQITQQVIDMARASLTLPLFANISGSGSHGRLNGLSNRFSSGLANGLSSNHSSGLSNGLSNGHSNDIPNGLRNRGEPSNNLANLEAALRMSGGQSSNLFQSSNREPLQLSNTPLLSVPFRRSGMNNFGSNNFDSEAALHQMMQAALPNNMMAHRSLDPTFPSYQNQLNLQRELDSNQAFLSQAMQSHAADFDSGPQDMLGLADFSNTLTGRNYQDHWRNGLRLQVQDAHGDELINMINASLREHF
jgi:hypothetical protein